MAEERDLAGPFPDTPWTALRRAAGNDDEEARQRLDRLLRQYLPALRAHLLARQHVAAADADDLLQGFVVDRVLEHHLLTRAQRQRGRFRAFLVASLDHYVANNRRFQRAARRRPREGRVIALQPGQEPPAPHHADAFERAWAQQLLEEALRRTREQCDLSGRSDLWRLFELRVLRPALHDVPPVPYAELIETFGYGSPAEASNALVTAKRIFARTLRQVVEEYCPGCAQEELEQLREILSKPGA